MIERINVNIKHWMSFVFVIVLSSCGGGESSDANGNVDQAGDELNYTVNLADNAVINSSRLIILTFDSTINPTAVNITGTIATESDGGVWTTTESSDDTLTLSPVSAWTAGSKTLLVEVNDDQGKQLKSISLNYIVDATAPQISSVSPLSGSVIGASQQITITFDESMDVNSQQISGTMGTNSDAGTWSSTGANSNDKLTISPVSSWQSGDDQTLSLNAFDVAGNPIATVDLTYVVDTSAPSVVSISAANGSILLAAQPIEIVFDRTMDVDSLVLGNNMLAESNTGVWSDTKSINDTLTISPITNWTQGYWENNDGVAQALSIDVNDVSGNAISTLNLTYIVDVISVSKSGDNNNIGTISLPVATLSSAIAKAAALGVSNVYIQAGTYSGGVTITDGINIKGGFNGVWILDDYSVTGHGVTLDGTGNEIVLASDITSDTRIENLIVMGPDVSGTIFNAAQSSHVIRVLNSSNLVIDKVQIIAGNGADGASGDNGRNVNGPGSVGAPGGKAAELATFFCNDESAGGGGAGGGGTGSTAGGKGGRGGTADTSCSFLLDATSGSPGSNAVAYSGEIDGKGKGGNAGSGDTQGSCDDSLKGMNGVAGRDGNAGVSGQPATEPTGTITDGLWLVSGDGGDGFAGSDAMGGGGGGGSGGCDSGNDKYGAGGGGGGQGGRGATVAGTGGKAGGFSIGILVLNSSVSISNTLISLGNGGAGGDGGDSGIGQLGGSGGSGGAWVSLSIGIAGGNGGAGGKGGDSGSGAGGAGGSAYGIYSVSSTVNTNNITFDGGAFGTGGSSINSGVEGVVLNEGPVNSGP